MATSEYHYRVLLDLADVGVAKKALDPTTSRSLMSNLNHMADEFAQVRVTYSGTVAALSGKAGYLSSRTPTSTATPYAVTSWSFPMSIRAQGQSYKLRVRIGGATANATATATFTAVLSPGNTAPASVGDASDAVYVTAGTASTAAAWLTGVSQGAGAYTTMMEMNAAQVAACWNDFPTKVSLSGDPATVTCAWVTLSIFAETTNVTHVPRLYSVYAAEVIGL